MFVPLIHPEGRTCPRISQSFLGRSAPLGFEGLALRELVELAESAARDSFVLAPDSAVALVESAVVGFAEVGFVTAGFAVLAWAFVAQPHAIQAQPRAGRRPQSKCLTVCSQGPPSIATLLRAADRNGNRYEAALI